MADAVVTKYSEENFWEALWRWLTAGGTADPASTAPKVGS